MSPEPCATPQLGHAQQLFSTAESVDNQQLAPWEVRSLLADSA
jgi:hypothetical protein